jgi:diguanylate cyclase (GGDEF)-like protein
MRLRRAPFGSVAHIVAPVCAGGFAVALAAVFELATGRYGATALLGIAALLAVSMAAERFPVPLDGVDTGGVTLTFVFGVAAIALFGWAAGVIVFFAAPGVMHVIEHRPPVRAAFNASQFGVSAAIAGALASLVHGPGVPETVGVVAVAATAHYVVNVTLITAVVAHCAGKPFAGALRSGFALTAPAFALMASAALVLVVLWQREPALSLAVAGPLLAIALYQRSYHRELDAMRLALTDPLTGLGNQRHFQECLRRELFQNTRAKPLTLCLVDVDDFKIVNDRFGHPAGDRVLMEVAEGLLGAGSAFRVGGDEFAVLLPGIEPEEAAAVASAFVERISGSRGDGPSITVSVGVACRTTTAIGQDELLGQADAALYAAKANGKNQVRVASAEAGQHAVAA